MDAYDWLHCNDPEPMLAFVSDLVPVRKLRLVGCACWRRLDPDDWQLPIVERLADGTALPEEAAELWQEDYLQLDGTTWWETYLCRVARDFDDRRWLPAASSRLAVRLCDQACWNWVGAAEEAAGNGRIVAVRSIMPDVVSRPAWQEFVRRDDEVRRTGDRAACNEWHRAGGVWGHMRSAGEVTRGPKWEAAWAAGWEAGWAGGRRQGFLPGSIYDPVNWSPALHLAWGRTIDTLRDLGWQYGPDRFYNPTENDEWTRFIDLFEREGIDLERAALADLVRDVIGPYAFEPVRLDPRWLTSDVRALCRGIYEDYAFDRLPILADALQEAGCDEDECILAHCRGPGPHARGCWAVDLLLGWEQGPNNRHP